MMMKAGEQMALDAKFGGLMNERNYSYAGKPASVL